MKVEIEAKMAVSNPQEVEERLRAVGAEAGPVVAEVNTFFDTPALALKAGDQGLRVRVEQEIDGPYHAVTITHKGPRAHGKLKSRWETELKVADATDAAQLLTALGFHKGVSFEKRRKNYTLDSCAIAIDQLPHLGHFIEIEGPSEEAVLRCREKLGLAHLPLAQASYISMLTTYLAERRMTRTEIRFED